ncbi:alpha-ketoglutarate-dependent dioxygenase AlkB [Streptomyces sp. NPDC059906]|uniref:alpha-ketoglutarate-dependent dioxygenase AlkB n=1 Tax=Streptomyces sp. NPDC059906 TaxID=3346997 RepID=UPI00364B4786
MDAPDPAHRRGQGAPSFLRPDPPDRPHTDTELRSGDLFVFGGPSRLAYHGVPRVHPGTAPPELGLGGRLNITLRVSGF